MRKHHHAVHKIAQNGHQLIIHPRLVVEPGKIAVLTFRCDGRQHIPQFILSAGQIHQIFMQPNRVISRCADFLSFQIEEFVGRHLCGKHIGSMLCKNHRKNNGMKNDVILADEVHKLCIWRLPPCFPCFFVVCATLKLEILTGCADVANWGIKPDIQNFAFSAL